jgi:hypothetical protein
MNYHNIMYTKIPETGLGHTLYTLYSADNRSFKLDHSKMLTNCNLILLDKIDRTGTSDKVCCIPIGTLESILSIKTREVYADISSMIDYKKDLLEKVREVYTDEELFMKCHIFYKPIFTKDSVTKDGWELHPITDNIIENNSKSVRESSNKELWLSNFNLASLMKSYVLMKPKTLYVGVMFLSCFDNLSNGDMNEIYRRSALNTQIKLLLTSPENRDYNYIIGFIVSYSHWSSIIIDKLTMRVYHYCSGGNNPKDYISDNKIIFYSTTRSFVKTSSNIKSNHRKVVSKYHIFKQLIQAGYTVYMNVESSQMVSGECGIFAAMFLILFCTNEVNNHLHLKALYNSFSFLGDKSMGMYKDLLFWRRGSQHIETVSISQNILREWSEVLECQSLLLEKAQDKMVNELMSMKKVTNN